MDWETCYASFLFACFSSTLYVIFFLYFFVLFSNDVNSLSFECKRENTYCLDSSSTNQSLWVSCVDYNDEFYQLVSCYFCYRRCVGWKNWVIVIISNSVVDWNTWSCGSVLLLVVEVSYCQSLGRQFDSLPTTSICTLGFIQLLVLLLLLLLLLEMKCMNLCTHLLYQFDLVVIWTISNIFVCCLPFFWILVSPIEENSV